MFAKILVIALFLLVKPFDLMSIVEKNGLKNKVLEMFDHAFNSYMKYAFPADELMPLSCKGRYRDTEQNRGDIDDVLGNYTLTLVDSLDTLAVLGKLVEFEKAVIDVINNTNFDRDVVVSVFESNIRMVGGLLGGHVSAKYLQTKYPNKYLAWYKNELLDKAKELGYRILPAFNTTSGLPYPRVNLKYGITNEIEAREDNKFTCTACAGTLILEFAALSRLTGEEIFEIKARKTLDYIWDKRNRASDLVGTVLNVHNGDWINKDSSIGAGIDSYYEYLFKAYILLGDDTFLQRFNRHYDSIMKFMNQQHGSIMHTVHMHMPYRSARNYMDALLAFWPGLQVLKGDIKEAIKMHELLYKIVQKHKFLPEAFLSDHSVHWSNHPLRPEFLESTYFLYRATKDPYYLEIGKQIIEHLEMYARVKCGYAAIADVKSIRHEDRIDSFVYAETFKYLYLLFEDHDNLEIDVDDFVFTTEAHLLPLSLVNQKLDMRNISKSKTPTTHTSTSSENSLLDKKSCPSLKFLFNNQLDATKRIRESVSSNGASVPVQCGTPSTTTSVPLMPKVKTPPPLRATDFIVGNSQHQDLLKKMGIKLSTMEDGRLQLIHYGSQANSVEDAEHGLAFMNEMLELSKQQNSQFKMTPQIDEYGPVSVVILRQPHTHVHAEYHAGPAQFGFDFKNKHGVFGLIEVSQPLDACGKIKNLEALYGKIVIAKRGSCMFVDKVRKLEKAGAIAVIIMDNVENSSFVASTLFAMSGDGLSNVKIGSVFLYTNEAKQLLELYEKNTNMILYLGVNNIFQIERAFYKSLPTLRDTYVYKKQPNKKTCKNAYEGFVVEEEDVCMKDDYLLFGYFFDYIEEVKIPKLKMIHEAEMRRLEKFLKQAEPVAETSETEESIKFDDCIELSVKENGSRQLKINLKDFIESEEKRINGPVLSASDEYMNIVYENVKYRFETHTNIARLDDYTKYLGLLRQLIKISINNYVYTKNMKQQEQQQPLQPLQQLTEDEKQLLEAMTRQLDRK